MQLRARKCTEGIRSLLWWMNLQLQPCAMIGRLWQII